MHKQEKRDNPPPRTAILTIQMVLHIYGSDNVYYEKTRNFFYGYRSVSSNFVIYAGVYLYLFATFLPVVSTWARNYLVPLWLLALAGVVTIAAGLYWKEDGDPYQA